MNLLKRIKAKTPKKDKRDGRIFTIIGAVCGAILTAGVVTAPLGVTLLTIGAVAFGGAALNSAQKVRK